MLERFLGVLTSCILFFETTTEVWSTDGTPGADFR